MLEVSSYFAIAFGLDEANIAFTLDRVNRHIMSHYFR